MLNLIDNLRFCINLNRSRNCIRLFIVVNIFNKYIV